MVSTLVFATVFVVLLGVLIFVHELGHFVAAKRAGIYVERFSIGFGRRLFGKRIGETDYCVSALPLGGYVRMAGQSDMPQRMEEGQVQLEQWEANVPEEQRFTSKPPWVRAIVLLAGPLMNGLFGVMLFPLALMIGEQVPSYALDTRVGSLVEGAPAEQAGVEFGDRILRVGDVEVSTFSELALALVKRPDIPTRLTIERGDEIVHIEVTPTVYDEDGVPGIGVGPFVRAKVGDVMEGWPAEQAGLAPGDVITHANGELVDQPRLAVLLNDTMNIPVELTVERADGSEFTTTVVPRKAGVLEDVVFDPDRPGRVARVIDESSPWREGDVIVAVNGAEVDGQEALEIIRANPNKTALFAVMRRAVSGTKRVEIAETIGARGMIGMNWDNDLVMVRYPPGEAVVRGLTRSLRSIDLIIRTVRWLIRGQIGIQTVRGPLGIYGLARDAWDTGFVAFMNLAAMLSINFFIVNLLPIPVLDGGQLVLVGAEAVRRRPASIRTQIWLQRVGLVLIALLMLVVCYNDIVRGIKELF